MELGGYCRRAAGSPRRLAVPGLAALERFLKSTEDREISTTMAFVQILQTLLRDKNIGKHIVPIVPDESRTFGMEGLFRQLGIWNQLGQLYTPQDADQLMFYKESEGRPGPAGRHQRGRRDVRLDGGGDQLFDARRADDPVLHLLFDVRLPARRRSGLGRRRHALARLPARRHRRADDAEWRRPAARGRAFARLRRRRSRTASRTIRSFGYELAVIIQDGLRRMYAEQQDVYYYLTVMNENYASAGDARRRRAGHHQGHVPVQGGAGRAGARTRRRASSCSARA